MTRPGHTATEYAWLAEDDPFPFFVVIAHVAGAAARKLRHRLAGRLMRKRPA